MAASVVSWLSSPRLGTAWSPPAPAQHCCGVTRAERGGFHTKWPPFSSNRRQAIHPSTTRNCVPKPASDLMGVRRRNCVKCLSFRLGSISLPPSSFFSSLSEDLSPGGILRTGRANGRIRASSDRRSVDNAEKNQNLSESSGKEKEAILERAENLNSEAEKDTVVGIDSNAGIEWKPYPTSDKSTEFSDLGDASTASGVKINAFRKSFKDFTSDISQLVETYTKEDEIWGSLSSDPIFILSKDDQNQIRVKVDRDAILRRCGIDPNEESNATEEQASMLNIRELRALTYARNIEEGVISPAIGSKICKIEGKESRFDLVHSDNIFNRVAKQVSFIPNAVTKAVTSHPVFSGKIEKNVLIHTQQILVSVMFVVGFLLAMKYFRILFPSDFTTKRGNKVEEIEEELRLKLLEKRLKEREEKMAMQKETDDSSPTSPLTSPYSTHLPVLDDLTDDEFVEEVERIRRMAISVKEAESLRSLKQSKTFDEPQKTAENGNSFDTKEESDSKVEDKTGFEKSNDQALKGDGEPKVPEGRAVEVEEKDEGEDEAKESDEKKGVGPIREHDSRRIMIGDNENGCEEIIQPNSTKSTQRNELLETQNKTEFPDAKVEKLNTDVENQITGQKNSKYRKSSLKIVRLKDQAHSLSSKLSSMKSSNTDDDSDVKSSESKMSKLQNQLNKISKTLSYIEETNGKNSTTDVSAAPPLLSSPPKPSPTFTELPPHDSPIQSINGHSTNKEKRNQYVPPDEKISEQAQPRSQHEDDEFDWKKDERLYKIVMKVKENEDLGRGDMDGLTEEEMNLFFDGLEKLYNRQEAKLNEFVKSKIENFDYGRELITINDPLDIVTPKWKDSSSYESSSLKSDFKEQILNNRRKIFDYPEEGMDLEKENNIERGIENEKEKKIESNQAPVTSYDFHPSSPSSPVADASLAPSLPIDSPFGSPPQTSTPSNGDQVLSIQKTEEGEVSALNNSLKNEGIVQRVGLNNNLIAQDEEVDDIEGISFSPTPNRFVDKRVKETESSKSIDGENNQRPFPQGFQQILDGQTDPEVIQMLKSAGKDLKHWTYDRDIDEALTAEEILSLDEQTLNFRIRQAQQRFEEHRMRSKSISNHGQIQDSENSWWLKKKVVGCIVYELKEGESAGEGLYILDVLPGVEKSNNLGPKLHIIGFENLNEAKYFCCMIEMSEGRSNAKLHYFKPEELQAMAKENDLGVTILKDGQLKFALGQPIEEVEERIAQIAESKLVDQIIKTQGFDLMSVFDDEPPPPHKFKNP